MSEGATGQPVEVPAESPAPPKTTSRVRSEPGGSPPSGEGTRHADGAAGAATDAVAGATGEGSGPRPANRRRRGSRGGRGRSPSAANRVGEENGAEPADAVAT